MSEGEFIFWIIVWVFAFVAFMNGFWNTKKPNNTIWEDYSKREKDRTKLFKKLDKAKLVLENLLIKKEELENEIDKLHFDSSIDFENENQNNTKIRKYELQLKQIDMKIEEVDDNIYNINRELQWIY